MRLPNQHLAALYNTNLVDYNCREAKRVLEYLMKDRGLSKRTLRKYGVGRATKQHPLDKSSQPSESITFPCFKPALNKNSNTRTNYVISRIKVQPLEQHAHWYIDPPDGPLGLFGYHTIPSGSKEIVVTQDEYDAMSVNQATGRAAVSLPNTGTKEDTEQCLQLLKPFDKIYLWIDHNNNDPAQQEKQKGMAQMIGIYKCFLVKPLKNTRIMPNDANDALLLNQDLNEILNGAEISEHPKLATMKNYRDEIIGSVYNH